MVHDRRIIGHAACNSVLQESPWNLPSSRCCKYLMYILCAEEHICPGRQADTLTLNPEHDCSPMAHTSPYKKPINLKLESKFHNNSQPYEPYCGACAVQLTGTDKFSRSKQWEEEQTATKEKEYGKQTTQVVCHNRDWTSSSSFFFFFLYQRKFQLICHKHVFIFQRIFRQNKEKTEIRYQTLLKLKRGFVSHLLQRALCWYLLEFCQNQKAAGLLWACKLGGIDGRTARQKLPPPSPPFP